MTGREDVKHRGMIERKDHEFEVRTGMFTSMEFFQRSSTSVVRRSERTINVTAPDSTFWAIML